MLVSLSERGIDGIKHILTVGFASEDRLIPQDGATASIRADDYRNPLQREPSGDVAYLYTYRANKMALMFIELHNV